MQRPASIVTFERCYIGAWIVGLVNSILNWDAGMEAMNANPAIARLGPSFASTLTIGLLAISAAITWALWYYVSRRGLTAAKWIVTVFFGFALLSFVGGLVIGQGEFSVVAVVEVVAIVLQGIAVFMLFRPDTKAWFAGPLEPTA